MNGKFTFSLYTAVVAGPSGVGRRGAGGPEPRFWHYEITVMHEHQPSRGAARRATGSLDLGRRPRPDARSGCHSVRFFPAPPRPRAALALRCRSRKASSACDSTTEGVRRVRLIRGPR